MTGRHTKIGRNQNVSAICFDSGSAPWARQAGFAAGLGEDVPASTLNKVCGSGMKTVMMAHDLVRAGSAGMVVAGGMESMTNAPYLSPAMRGGARLGHQTMQVHMFLDGLEDAYVRGRLMGSFAEDCASRYQFSRAAQDEFALRSLERAKAAEADKERVNARAEHAEAEAAELLGWGRNTLTRKLKDLDLSLIHI